MDDILETLNDLGYDKLKEASLRKAVCGGPKSVEFTMLVEWVSKELQVLYSLDEHINAITTLDDSSSFLLELSSFLKEIGCQYSALLQGHVNERLHSESNKILLLDYLLTELKSARMVQANKKDVSLQLTLNESSTAADLKSLLKTLKFPKPPANIPPKVLFDKSEAKLKEVTSTVPIGLYGEPLFTGKLSDKQWHALENFYKELFYEYKIRREMLVKRLDVTIQSFEWSDRLKSKLNQIIESFQQMRNQLSIEPSVRLSDVLAARKDLAILEKTSSASVRRKTQCDINKVIIGEVPDRGGRANEQEPPPPEMPSWQQRSSGQSGGRCRGGNFEGGRGGYNAGTSDFRRNNDGPPRGGRVQAGWSEPPRNNYQNYYRSSQGHSNSGQFQYEGDVRGSFIGRSNNRNLEPRGRAGYQHQAYRDSRNYSGY